MDRLVMGALIAGVIAVIFGVAATFVVDMLNASADLDWALIAVGFASFFGGAAGYVAGQRDESYPVRQ